MLHISHRALVGVLRGGRHRLRGGLQPHSQFTTGWLHFLDDALALRTRALGYLHTWRSSYEQLIPPLDRYQADFYVSIYGGVLIVWHTTKILGLPKGGVYQDWAKRE